MAHLNQCKVRVIYSGRVQGVGFRMTVFELANQLKVNGWVCNVSNGTVEMEAVGDSQSLMNLMERIQQRMGRNIVDCTVDWMDGSEDEFSSFSIRSDKWGD